MSRFWKGFLFVIAATNSNKIRGGLEWRCFRDFYLFSDGKSRCNDTDGGGRGRGGRDENPRGEISKTELST